MEYSLSLSSASSSSRTHQHSSVHATQLKGPARMCPAPGMQSPIKQKGQKLITRFSLVAFF